MESKNIRFIGSYVKLEDLPRDKRPEIAFIGRSNVGKSSLINLLLERKNLARVSNEPGKTQCLNYFVIQEQWYLVDMPGYGYAKVSKKTRESWDVLIKSYLLSRQQLHCVFALIDSRVPPQASDLTFLNWLGENQVPFAIVFTKVDKLTPVQLDKNISAFRQNLLKTWETLPKQFLTSTVTKAGKAEVLAFVNSIIQQNQA
jgi:GTP-binding protein